MSDFVVRSGAVLTDIALVRSAYHKADHLTRRPAAVFGSLLQVRGDYWIGRLDKALTGRVEAAVVHKGENYNPIRQYYFPYAFVLKNASPKDENPYSFDYDSRLFLLMQLSRLVHPTAVGDAYAVRLIQRPNAADEIVPAPERYLGNRAYVLDENENWLIPDDLPLLRDLIQGYEGATPPTRVRRALWLHEAAARTYYVDISWPLLTAGLEALIKIPGEKVTGVRFAGSTQIFVDRLLGIGRLEPTLQVPESELRAIYADRSNLAHGQPLRTLDSSKRSIYRQLSALLRGILRKALLDPSFQAIFESDATVSSALPLRLRGRQ